MEDVLFCGLNLGAWITIVTVLSMFLTLIFTKLREEVAFLGVIAVLLLTGVLDTKEALGGFSSGSVVVIGVLFAVVAGLVHTGVMQWIVRYLSMVLVMAASYVYICVSNGEKRMALDRKFSKVEHRPSLLLA